MKPVVRPVRDPAGGIVPNKSHIVSRTMRCVPIVALRAEVRRPCFDSAGARQSARSSAGPPCIPTRSGEVKNFGRNDRRAPSVIRINGRPDRRRDGGRARKKLRGRTARLPIAPGKIDQYRTP